jgi:poly(3-hydroxybutyrate) depolymerase
MTEYSPNSFISSSHAIVKWLFMLLRLLLILPLVPSHGHDFGPVALTSQHGFSIPQTCIQVNNKRKRCYYTFLPDCAKGHTPVVYDIHDYDDSPQSLSERSGWLQLAQQQCFIIVWPIVSNTTPLIQNPCPCEL